MNRKKQIVCLGSEPWSTIPHRTQQIMSHLKGVDILYFSPPYPGASSAPPHRKRVKPNILVYILPKDVKKTSINPMFFSLRQKRLAQFISRIMAKHHVRKPLLWVTHPSQEEITCHLHYDTLVYDCVETWIEGYVHGQECLFRKADLIFVANQIQKKDVREYNRNVALLENGVDYSLFEEAALFARRDDQEVCLGFAGHIGYDLDLSPLLYVAHHRPDWRIKLLGSCSANNPYYEELFFCENVEFYEEYSVHVLAEFLYSCHVLLDFRWDGQGHDFKTSHFVDYFATGLPVVSHIWKDEVERFPDVVYISKSEEEFLENCEIARKEKSDIAVRRRKKYAQKGAWQKRGERVMQVLTQSHLM